ncbi:MAG: hypothetical protein NT099_08960 [Candidatus Saganbacteria bacterium]|nr:hypothetical protein [Candidatus Saganbacteria bacterium]
MIYLFTDKGATVAQAGGKGYSLIKMMQAGFNVPPGMVLSVDFFKEWLDKLEAITELKLNKNDSDDTLKRKIQGLKNEAEKLTLSETQKKLLTEKLKLLGPIPLFSIRSSSPEEDMAGASFAGMYETYLGIKSSDLEENIRKVFLSCIDYRVVVYKRQHNFDFTKFSIAVVVMEQIKSQVAGVAFSANPLNNCYDEIVINANFGVGESVVSGDMVPDQFIVDKYKNEIISKEIGKKQVSIIVSDDGGTKTLNQSNSDITLTDQQILELVGIVKKIEEYYKMPMDIEWAYANNQFYMIQARPITTIIPLHPAFLTEQGKPKILYLDLTLVEQGIQKPLSVMGTDCFRILTNEMGISAAGIEIAGKPGDLAYAAGGRAYVNLSNEILLEGQKQAAAEYAELDSYAAQTIKDTDMSEYRGHVNISGVWATIKALITGTFKSWDLITEILSGNKHPEKLRTLPCARPQT